MSTEAVFDPRVSQRGVEVIGLARHPTPRLDVYIRPQSTMRRLRGTPPDSFADPSRPFCDFEGGLPPLRWSGCS